MTLDSAALDQMLALAGQMVGMAGQLTAAVKTMAEQQAQGRDISEDERVVFKAQAAKADQAWAAAMAKLAERTKG